MSWSLRSVGVSILALALLGSAGCDVEPQVDITRGSAPSKELANNLRPFALDLPADISDAEWIQAVDWDVQDVYIRFRTTKDGFSRLLTQCGIQGANLEPSQADASAALPSDSPWADRFPKRIAGWKPDSWAGARVFEKQPKTNCGYVDLLVEQSDDPLVFLHLTGL